MLLEVGFNKEVGLDTALYWTKEDVKLADLIDRTDTLSSEEIDVLGKKAKERVRTAYSWDFICKQYKEAWIREF